MKKNSQFNICIHTLLFQVTKIHIHIEMKNNTFFGVLSRSELEFSGDGSVGIVKIRFSSFGSKRNNVGDGIRGIDLNENYQTEDLLEMTKKFQIFAADKSIRCSKTCLY